MMLPAYGPTVTAALVVLAGVAVLFGGLLIIHHIDFSSPSLLTKYVAHCIERDKAPKQQEVDFLLGATHARTLDTDTARRLRHLRKRTHNTPLATLARRRHWYSFDGPAQRAWNRATSRTDGDVPSARRLSDDTRPVVAYVEAATEDSGKETFNREQEPVP